jgi:DNA-binding NarL/FixJ family response regulator
LKFEVSPAKDVEGMLGGIMATQIVIADDHLVFAQALAQLLAERYAVVDIVADGRALQIAARKHKPDVIVTDITMPLMSGIESIRSLSRDSHMPKVVFLSMHTDTEIARECFNCGGAAFLSKDFHFDELIAAIEAVISDRLYLSPRVAGGLIDTLRDNASTASETEKLTSRQREILQLFAEGKSTKEIASVVNLSTRTVEWHKYRMMRVLQVRRSAELVQHAIRMKLVV